MNGTMQVGRMGNGTALHLIATAGSSGTTYALCNRWGSVNGRWIAPRIVEDAQSTCKRCEKIALKGFEK